MYLKDMSAEDIRRDLFAINQMFPKGVPWEQVDRVNALRGELKRRGEPIDGPIASMPNASPLNARTLEELETELRKLSTLDDEDSRKRFTEVKSEIRLRNSKMEPTKPTSPMPPRMLEIQDEDEIFQRSKERLEAIVGTTKKEIRQEFLERNETKMYPVSSSKVTSVCGISAASREDGGVVITYAAEPLMISRVFDVEQMYALIGMLSSALTDARSKSGR